MTNDSLVKEKVKLWENNNNKIIDAILKKDSILLEEIYDEHISMKSLSELLTDEEGEILGQYKYEEINEDMEDKFHKCMIRFFNEFKKKDNIFLELLADKVINTKGDFKSYFRKDYYSYTSDWISAKKHLIEALKIGNKDVFFAALHGVMFNNKTKIYDEIISEIPNKILSEIGVYPLLNSPVNGNRYYNIETFEKFFQNHIKKYKKNINKKKSAINDYENLIYNIINVPFFSSKKDINLDVRQAIISLVIDDYKKEKSIPNDEMALIDLFFKKHNEMQEKINNMKTPNSRNKNHFGQLVLGSKMLSLDSWITNLIQESINMYNIEECLKFFKKINLPTEKYEVIDRFVGLKNQISTNNKKMNKIKKI